MKTTDADWACKKIRLRLPIFSVFIIFNSLLTANALAVDISTSQLPLQYRCKTTAHASVERNDGSDSWAPYINKKPKANSFVLTITRIERADNISGGLTRMCEVAAMSKNALNDEGAKNRRKLQLDVCAAKRYEAKDLTVTHYCSVSNNNLDCEDFAFDAEKLSWFQNSQAAGAEMMGFFSLIAGKCERL